MCFNGVNTWQLGWFSAYYVDLPSDDNKFYWSGNLVGFAEKSRASRSDPMIIRIRGDTLDYYVHFNRKIGMNSETQEGGDQVLITSRTSGTEMSPTSLLGKLSANDAYSIPAFSGLSAGLKIFVSSINLSTAPARASVTVFYDAKVDRTSPPTTKQFTKQPTRRSPRTKPPTPAPTKKRMM